jgi:regulatory protein
MRITKILPGKFKKGMMSIYADGKYILSLPEEAVYRLNLKEGDEYEQDEFDSLIRSQSKTIAMDSAMRLISVRSRSKKELEQRLKLKKHNRDTIETVTGRLGDLGYINDEKFAFNWANYRKSQNKGSELIKNELRGKGIAAEVIEAAVKSLYASKEEEIAQIKQCAEKKLKNTKGKDANEISRKLLGYLARRGFPLDRIMDALRELKKEFNFEEL